MSKKNERLIFRNCLSLENMRRLRQLSLPKYATYSLESGEFIESNSYSSWRVRNVFEHLYIICSINKPSKYSISLKTFPNRFSFCIDSISRRFSTLSITHAD